MIEAAHYGEARAKLAADPIIVAMATELAGTPLDSIAHENGSPRFEFMGAATREYERRGGRTVAHLGACAEAVLLVLAAGEVS